MRLVIRARAARDLILAWIAKDNPRAAVATVDRIEVRLERLAGTGLPHSGRPGRIACTRELVEPPYVIVYRVFEDRDEVHVLSILHGARRRP